MFNTILFDDNSAYYNIPLLYSLVFSFHYLNRLPLVKNYSILNIFITKRSNIKKHNKYTFYSA